VLQIAIERWAVGVGEAADRCVRTANLSEQLKADRLACNGNADDERNGLRGSDVQASLADRPAHLSQTCQSIPHRPLSPFER
jgi:hypothetical protein